MNSQAARDTYRLLVRFSMPHGNATKDAISLPQSHGLILISLYSLMIKLTITQFWCLIVLLGVALFMRMKHSDNRAAATVGVFNAQSSPTSVATLALRYVLHMKGEVWYPLMWVVLAVIALGASVSASIFLTPLLKIGNVAPVRPEAVFLPLITASQDVADTAAIYSLEVPGALRAVGAAGSIGNSGNVVVEEIDSTDDKNNRIVNINYGYKVYGADFGLQHAPDLVLDIAGSCITDYTWYVNTTVEPFSASNSAIKTITDLYYLWGNSSQPFRTSNSDNGPPFGVFFPNTELSNLDKGISVFGIVPSSIWRYSFLNGTDPWYLTRDSSDFYTGAPFPFLVRSQRPPLSCSETAIWSFRGNSSNVFDLDQVPGLNLPPVLTDMFKEFLGAPMVMNTGIRLGRLSLASSATSALGSAFNANSSSIHNDLVRLVNASYIATRNVLADTTTFSNLSSLGLTNIARGANGQPRDGTGDFVVSSPDIMTLSVRALIIVPVMLVVAILLLFLIGKLPAPWRISQALYASIIYSHLHEKAGAKAEVTAKPDWQRQSIAAYNGRPGDAVIRPEYNEKGELVWTEAGRAPPAAESNSGKTSSTAENDPAKGQPDIAVAETRAPGDGNV